MEEDPTHPQWLQDAVKFLHDHVTTESDEKRVLLRAIWKRAEYYWNDVQDIFLDVNSGEWATYSPDENETELSVIQDNNKVINTYRAFGESIIAAATIGNLSIRFFPENAESPADLDKSLSFSDKADYIQRINNIKELRRKAFAIRWNQGQVCSYVYRNKDKKYGTYKQNKTATKPSLVTSKSCTGPNCTYIPEPSIVDAPEDFASLEQPLEMGEDGQPIEDLCPECNFPLKSQTTQEETSYITGIEIVDREGVAIEIYSPLEFIIPYYAKVPEDINYIHLRGEIHYAKARSLFPDYAKKIASGRMVDNSEALDRQQADHQSPTISTNLVTISREWYKPEMYYVLLSPDENDTVLTDLQEEYPEGLHAIYVDDCLVKCENIDMDKHFSFVRSALDTHVYLRALGNAMIPIQDMENDLVFITMDTIRHAVGETFYDSRILNSKVYAKQQARPGQMYPLNLKGANRPVAEYFHTLKNAALSQEVDRFHERLESRGQLVTGAFPSIYGGQFGEGSKTLGVYELSRSQALQRVTIPANGIDDFLAETVSKATVLYDEGMEDDEVYTTEDGASGYKNITLRKSSPEGNIARVEAVKSEQFPTTWEQKRAFVMELLDKQVDPANPIAATIFASDNISLMPRIIGIPELKVPGDADRNKQLHEIQELLKSPPKTVPPEQAAIIQQQAQAAGAPPEQIQQMLAPKTTVDPDFDVDNDQIHIDSIVSWAVSPEGIRVKKQTPELYENVILHLRAHKENQKLKMAEMNMMQQGPNPESEESDGGEVG